MPPLAPAGSCGKSYHTLRVVFRAFLLCRECANVRQCRQRNGSERAPLLPRLGQDNRRTPARAFSQRRHLHGPRDGFIKYPEHIRSLQYFLWFLSIWIMPALFLISGVSAYHALQYRTAAEYARERRGKLLLPLLAGLLLVCPPMAYLRALYIGTFQGSFLRFYPHFFSEGSYPQGNLNWGHFWFLAYLFVFTLILRPLFARAKKEGLRQGLIRASLPLEKGASIYLVAVPLMLSETLLRPHFPGMQNLVWDWANFVLYLVLVFYGFVFAVNGRILDNIYRLRLFSLCFGAVLFAIAVGWRTSGVARSMGPAFPAYGVLMLFA